MPASLLMIRYPIKTSLGYMWLTSILGIVLGGVMLFYPGGTLSLMNVSFRIFQSLLTVFIAYYTLSESYHSFKAGDTAKGVVFLALGLVFIGLIWFLKIGLIYYVIAFFFVVTGLIEIAGSFTLPFGRFFLLLLGLMDLLFAAVIIEYPVVLALLIAWYVLFWGISRLCLAFELKGIQDQQKSPV
ncbi:MAG: DUF308 domain-containing protein [bacterium]